MVNLLRDLRFGLRMLLKNPGLTIMAVLTLGLGIGLTATMFSIVKGIVLSELPFEDGGRILFVGTRYLDRNEATATVSLHDFLDWKSRQSSFEDIAAFQQTTFNLSGGEIPERIRGAYVTSGVLPLLRVKPLIGRVFSPGEDSPAAPEVVLMGAGLWSSRYGRDPQIVGKAIRVNGRPATIIGVMPEGFLFPVHEELWMPLRLAPESVKRGSGPRLDVLGRLRDGSSPEKAQAELSALAKALEKEYPETNTHVGAQVGPYTEKYVNAEAAALLFVMLGVVSLVLLLACANVASLLMARASVRTQELAIRSVLGAGRKGVILQILIESLILALAGAALGLLATGLGIKLFNGALSDSNPPFWFNAAIDLRSLSFVLAISGIAGLLSGLVPALQASRVDVHQVLKDQGRGSTHLRIGRFTRTIVVFDLALSCALLVGTGLMIRTILNIRHLDLGFTRTGLLTASLTLDEPGSQSADRVRWVEQLLQGVRELPGVVSAAAADTLPTEFAKVDVYAVEGRAYPNPKDQPRAHKASASAGLFKTLGAPIKAGRDFGPEDHPGSLPVVIVNESFARKAWPNEDPLNRRIRLGKSGSDVWRTVVGVVPDLRMNSFDQSDRPDGIYLPIAQEAPVSLRLAIKTMGDPLALTAAVRQKVTAIRSDLPLDSVQSMDDVVSKNTFAFNLFGALFGLFGIAALLLASVGIYGVTSFSVQQRTREVGIRMAVGAQRRDILSLLLGQGARQLAFGLGVGLLLAGGISLLIGGLLVQVQPFDPAVFLGVVLVLAMVALFSCGMPALRATQVDPQVAIRYE